MITLVASTITKLLKAEKRPRLIRLSSDSTTVTRIGKNNNILEGSASGHGLTAYESILIELPPDEELFAVSSGTPNISWAEVGLRGALMI
jgi:hypothetical protein